MSTLTKVAWRRAQSLYANGPASAVHLLDTEHPERTLCGREVPAEARPGYQQPARLAWFEVNVTPLDCTIDPDGEDGHLSDFAPDEYRECGRCKAKATR